MDILENGRKEDTPLIPAKFGAYFSLYSSSTLEVSFPKLAVIADKEITTVKKVDFVTYLGEDVDDDVTEMDYPLKLNAWDGQGLISPRLAENSTMRRTNHCVVLGSLKCIPPCTFLTKRGGAGADGLYRGVRPRQRERTTLSDLDPYLPCHSHLFQTFLSEPGVFPV